MENVKTTDIALFAKSFYLLGDSLDHCYDCKYCRLNGEKSEDKHYNILPSEINPIFTNLPVAVNLFYGDPLLQIENTVNYLRKLEEAEHKGPVIIVTKGDFSKFPDERFNLDLHIAFSTFGVNSYLDGSSMERFENNLKQIELRKNNYKYSIEYRPIVYNVNDTVEAFEKVFTLAKKYNLAVGYSGLQGKPESVKIWQEKKINLQPYPGYKFGHKKIIDDKVVMLFEKMAKYYNVPVFRKTSCLFSYVHGFERDYNAHYYRPNEMGCNNCIMKDKCMNFKKNLSLDNNLDEVIPFKYEIINKQKHECILKKKGICEYPTEDCSNISGNVIHISKMLTTSDVRVIKWLTGYTVDANFNDSFLISEDWIKNKSLILRNK
ncbi:MAG TPA: hypothetical protein OIM63_02945 [Bacilli bacterium]|nr:hypothetical protein [Bacilli bacterium]